MEKTVLLSLTTLCFLAFTLTSHTSPDQPVSNGTPSPVTIEVKAEITDTIPSEGVYRIHKKTDDQDITIEVENGDIKELKIDGKEIQPSEYEQYDKVISDLFGGVTAPIAIESFDLRMPSVPAMPEMQGMPYMIEGLAFPDMPDMPEIQWEQYFNDDNMKMALELDRMAIMDVEGLANMHILTDSLPNGQTKIIIYHNGDSSVICTPGHGMEGQAAPYIHFYQDHYNKEDWQQYAEQWRAQAEEWRAHQQEWREDWRNQAEQNRARQQHLREMERHQYRLSEEQQQDIERELGQLDEIREIYVMGRPRFSLSDEMVKDGLIDPEDEVEVQLTPEKMKIDGEKMPEAIHQKYLDMYEQQQGIELSGNSKVEFKTKSKQRM